MDKTKKKFQILPHIADVKIKAWGKNYKELFKNAMLGMTRILSRQKIRTKFELKVKSEKLKIKVESQNINSLLIDFLNEGLYQTHVNREIYTDVKFLKFSNTNLDVGHQSLEAELFGHRVSEFEEDIKAVTYHGEGIKKTSKGFEVVILFDI